MPSHQLTRDRGTRNSETNQTQTEKEFTTDEEKENKLTLDGGEINQNGTIRTRDTDFEFAKAFSPFFFLFTCSSAAVDLQQPAAVQ